MSFARSSRRFNNLKAKRRLARGLPAPVQPRITRRRFVVENHLQDLDEWPILSEASRRMAIAHAFRALGYPDRDEWQCCKGTVWKIQKMLFRDCCSQRSDRCQSW